MKMIFAIVCLLFSSHPYEFNLTNSDLNLDESFKSNIAEEKILEKQKEKEKDGGWYSPWVHGTYPKKPNIHFIYFDYIKTDNNIEL